MNPLPLDAFIQAVHRRDLAALHATIDWSTTGWLQVRNAAAEADVAPDVRADAIRRGLDESRRAATDMNLTAPYLDALLRRLGTVKGTRPAEPAEIAHYTATDPDLRPGDPAGLTVVEGDEPLLVAPGTTPDRLVVLGWCQST